jgi:hypothetical protein
MTASADHFGPLTGSDGEHRRARRERARSRTVRRRRRVAALTLIVVVAALVLGVASLSGGSQITRAPLVKARDAGGTRTVAVHPANRAHQATRSPGSLPQTHAYPSGSSAQFRSLMASLWAGIVRGSVTGALPAFFPKGAYLQLKAIASASSDWTDRLVYDYGLDITAAHALLGGSTAHAQLIAVNVPSGYGHWVPPGVCDNSIGYYEMPNARIVYRESGQVRSFGIASMISWRGVWYVVHLGAVLRSSDAGTVDEPASGSGTSAYSGTC